MQRVVRHILAAAIAVVLTPGSVLVHALDAKDQAANTASWTIVQRPQVPEASVEDLGVMVSLGSVARQHTFGPSSDGDGLSIYTFAQRGHSVDELVEVNLQSGRVAKFDPKMTGDPWRQMWGKDGKWYYGAGHLLAFDPKAKQAEDLGTPAAGQTVHSLCWGPDDRIWIGCCTKGTLCCFDPKERKWHDYGQVGPAPPPKLPHYAEILGFDDGWVLVHRRNLPIVLAAVNMKTRQISTLFVKEKSEQSYALRWIDERAYASITDLGPDGKPATRLHAVEDGALKPVAVFPQGSAEIKSWLRLDKFVPAGAAIPESLVGPADPAQPTRMVAWWQWPGQPWKKAEFEAPASPERLFRIKTMPDGRIFGSTYDLRVCFIYDPSSGKAQTLGTVSEGYNVYDFAFRAGKVYLIGYAGAILFEYDPARTWSRDRTHPECPSSPWPHKAPTDNPRGVGGLMMKHGHELAVGADGAIYMKGYPTRDDVGGGFAWYDPVSQRNTIVREPFKVLAITCLAPVLGGKFMALGTRVDPDPMKRTPTPPAAKIFLFDTEKKQFVGDDAPFPNRQDTGRLVEGRPGVLLGIAPDEAQGKTLVYWFDIQRRTLVGQATLDGLLSGAQPGPDGALWGFFSRKFTRSGSRIATFDDDRLVRIDPHRNAIEPLVRLNRCRFTFSGKDLYFMKNPAGEETAHLFRVKDVLSKAENAGVE